MRIVCISDTHGFHDRIHVPDGDLLLVAGDVCLRGGLAELVRFHDWLAALPHHHKVLIAGNHDFCFERLPAQARAVITQAHYLEDSEVLIEGLRIYGSPWQPRFFDWAFNLDRGPRLREKWEMIPEGIDILITHGPPAGILDRCSDGREVGCRDLRERVALVRPRLHLFGHIHEAYGRVDAEGITSLNACCCNLDYKPVQAPLTVDWPLPQEG